ncbi:zinc finger protein [Biomphalaria pfeifferi]|uniref:Zinc finger protein n=1 Tax=Biomphalaria pfeifferi TaxID=112525 RepID=A0AAD8CCL4_BIOPF|nr:zinc finger protein [Biomphalaria pfeifferi]
MTHPTCQWSTSTTRQRILKSILSVLKKLDATTVCQWRNGASGYPNASAAKPTKCTLNSHPASEKDYTTLKQALPVQFELTAEAYHKKFRGSRLEHRETYVNLCDRLDKFLIRWHAFSQVPETFDGLASLILSEQLLECMSPEVRVYVREQQASAPANIASAADRYLNARKDLKGKTTATDQQTDQPTSPAQSNLTPKTPEHNQAPGQQSAPPNHQSHHNHVNYSQHDSHHSTCDSRHTSQRQQQAPGTLSMVTPVPQPSAIDPSDQPEDDTYVVSTMAVAPQPTAIDLSKPELPPVLPHPTFLLRE